MNIARTDGNQELKGVDVTLPPGLTAKLAGVRYCPEAALAAAAANSGAAEAAALELPRLEPGRQRRRSPPAAVPTRLHIERQGLPRRPLQRAPPSPWQ